MGTMCMDCGDKWDGNGEPTCTCMTDKELNKFTYILLAILFIMMIIVIIIFSLK